MSELEAPLKPEPHINSVESVESALEQVKNQSKNIAEDALQQAALDITQEVKQYASQESETRPTILKSLSNWFYTQINRISQAVIALTVAALVALLTPFLVKFEIINEMQEISGNLSAAVAANSTHGILESTLDISTSTAHLEQQNSELKTAFKNLEATLQQGQPDTTLKEVEANLSALISTQNEKIDQLQRELKNTPRVITGQKPKYPRQLKTKLTQYIAKGKILVSPDTDDEIVNAWIGEVYFFISLMPSYGIDLKDIKDNLQLIHQAKKPFEDNHFRLRQTLTILYALNGWVNLK